MNYKLLFPSYRNRYLFIRRGLEKYNASGFSDVLHLGCGEGDYDEMIVSFAENQISCDINAADVEFARKLNGDLKVIYQIEDALNLSFDAGSFDLVISVDTLEHVEQPNQMLSEIGRVLKKDALCFLTFPRNSFPWTYDPVNKLLSFWHKKPISQGAYSFGHTHLPEVELVQSWAQKAGLELVEWKRLSGWLCAMLEMYWTGWAQALFKTNAGNHVGNPTKSRLRPGKKEPFFTKLTDLVIFLDQLVSAPFSSSIGAGMVFRKIK